MDKHYVAVLANLKQDHENIKQKLKRKKQEQLDAHEKKMKFLHNADISNASFLQLSEITIANAKNVSLVDAIETGGLLQELNSDVKLDTNGDDDVIVSFDKNDRLTGCKLGGIRVVKHSSHDSSSVCIEIP